VLSSKELKRNAYRRVDVGRPHKYQEEFLPSPGQRKLMSNKKNAANAANEI